MKDLSPLIGCAGGWRGKNTLQDPHTGKPDDSAATALVTPVIGGRFIQMDYTWGYQGVPQEGSLLIGFDPKAETFSACWIDSWHMGHKMMACSGPQAAGSTLSLSGSWAAPPGPDWGWRIEITAEGGRTLRMAMFNIWPDGAREELAVEAAYTKV
ncbi:MAG TPA: DUF1579 family protein [Thermoanaerobaculia bacterium]|nr:DUF1579 family protein [Thermoanaerobaculia bacterium]